MSSSTLPQWYRERRGRYSYVDAMESGIPVIRLQNTGKVKWRGDCGKCVSPEAMGDSDFWPEHESSCRHSFTAHCACRFD